MHSVFENHQTIAIDCDEVLTELIEFAIDHSTGKLANLLQSKEQITEYYITDMFPEIVRQDTVDFFREAITLDLEPLSIPVVEGAFEVLYELKKQGKQLFVVTARPKILEDYTRRYVQKHFPDIFTDIYFAEHFTANHRNKSDICKEIGATILVDDSMEYAIDCAENGIEVLLLEKPWNKNRTESHEKIQRISHWNTLSTH